MSITQTAKGSILDRWTASREASKVEPVRRSKSDDSLVVRAEAQIDGIVRQGGDKLTPVQLARVSAMCELLEIDPTAALEE